MAFTYFRISCSHPLNSNLNMRMIQQCQNFPFWLPYWPILENLANVLLPPPAAVQGFSCRTRCDGWGFCLLSRGKKSAKNKQEHETLLVRELHYVERLQLFSVAHAFSSPQQCLKALIRTAVAVRMQQSDCICPQETHSYRSYCYNAVCETGAMWAPCLYHTQLQQSAVR